jgi:hypothetical protein
MRRRLVRLYSTKDEEQALVVLAERMQEKNVPEALRTLIRRALADNRVPASSTLFGPVDFSWLRRKAK